MAYGTLFGYNEADIKRHCLAKVDVIDGTDVKVLEQELKNAEYRGIGRLEMGQQVWTR
jgi:hypothetical protein